MGLFNKKETEQQPRNMNNVIVFRLLAVGYILYMFWEVLQMYLAGGEDAPKLWMLLVAFVVLVGGPVWICIMTYKEWKRSRELAQQQADEEDEDDEFDEDEEYEDEFDDEEYEEE